MAFPESYELTKRHLSASSGLGSFGLYQGSVETITRLEIHNGENAHVLAKQGDSWYLGASAVEQGLEQLISELLKMLVGAEPVRTFQPEDLLSTDEKGYGFENADKLIVFDHKGPALMIELGNATPDGSLRYVRKQGDPALYVMSGFFQSQIKSINAAIHAAQPHSH